MIRLARLVGACALAVGTMGLVVVAPAGAEDPAPDLAVTSEPVPDSTPLGAAPPAETLSVSLQLATPGGLEAAVNAMNDPSSPEYRRYLDLPTVRTRFGASEQTQRRVLQTLARNGIEGTVDVTGLFVRAPMNAAQVNALFGVPLEQFRAPSGQTYVAPQARPANAPATARGIPGVVAISGLSTAKVATSAPPVAPASYSYANTGTPSGCAAAVATGGFTPNQLRTAYGFDSLHSVGLRGQGQSIAVLAIDGFSQSAMDAYTTCFGLPRLVPNIKPVAGTTVPLAPGPETMLDTQTIASFAPRIGKVHVLETDNNTESIFSNLFSAALDPANTGGSLVKVQSVSLGGCEPLFSEAALNLTEQTALRAASLGVSIVVASGDTGSSACLPFLGVYDASVSLPASLPWVTAVGGTNLSLSAANRIKDERVWNNEFPALGGGIDAGGGGGDSGYFPIPQWQRNAGVGGFGRAVPDIAFYGDLAPGWVLGCQGISGITTACTSGTGFVPIGGTSFAAPLFASAVALANQRAAQLAQPPVGLLNPLLYRLGPSGGNGMFRDVIKGSNDLGLPSAPIGCCTARVGFDRASGWGSLDVARFVTAANQPVPGYLMANLYGGVFTFGSARFAGSLNGVPLRAPIVSIISRPQHDGYWMISSDGGVFSFGGAPFKGSLGGIRLNNPIVGATPAPDGAGYFMVSSDGGVFTFGSARFAGSMGGIRLNNPVVGIAVNPANGGYWLVSSDGGIFSFGGAPFYGSMGGIPLTQPVTSIAATATGKGYWMFSADGGVFTFGDAPFLGSAAFAVSARVMAGAGTSTGKGYWILTLNGGVFTFGDAPFLGTPSSNVIALAAA
ncbi:MAG: S53 family peptidase [Acidimicrobiia bacterium]